MDTPTVDDIADMVRVAYNATYSMDMRTYEARVVAGDIMSKPCEYIPLYLRKWLQKCSPNAHPTVLWLKQYL